MIEYILLTVIVALTFLIGFALGSIVMYVRICNQLKAEQERQVQEYTKLFLEQEQPMHEEEHDETWPPTPPLKPKKKPWGEEGEEWKKGDKKEFTDEDFEDLLDGKDNF